MTDTSHLDNRRGKCCRLTMFDAEYEAVHPHMEFWWTKPTTADQVIACDRIDSDLRRVVMLHEAWLLDQDIKKIEKRSGF